MSVLQVVNCWYTQLYVTSDVAVLCSFIRGSGGSVFQNNTYPEMLLYVEEGLSLLSGGFFSGVGYHDYSSLPHGK